jgi:hypothetical protein
MPKTINLKEKLESFEVEYGYTSSQVFNAYGKKDLDNFNIPKQIIMEWIHDYIAYNKNNLNLG